MEMISYTITEVGKRKADESLAKMPEWLREQFPAQPKPASSLHQAAIQFKARTADVLFDRPPGTTGVVAVSRRSSANGEKLDYNHATTVSVNALGVIEVHRVGAYDAAVEAGAQTLIEQYRALRDEQSSASVRNWVANVLQDALAGLILVPHQRFIGLAEEMADKLTEFEGHAKECGVRIYRFRMADDSRTKADAQEATELSIERIGASLFAELAEFQSSGVSGARPGAGLSSLARRLNELANRAETFRDVLGLYSEQLAAEVANAKRKLFGVFEQQTGRDPQAVLRGEE